MLTDEDRAAMLLLLEQNKDPYAFYLAGVRAGMERAAKIIESSTVEWSRNSGSYIAVIRASAEE